MNTDTIRRALAAAITAAVIALNQKLGLNLGATEIGGLLALAGLYIGQSVLKSIKLPEVPKVETAEDADKAFGLEEKK